MELPDDVLRIIREYSCPCFKYFREYKSMLRLCGFKQWHALRQALQLNPERVLPSLLAHEKSQTAWIHAYHEVLDREEKIRRGYYGKQDARAITYSALVKSIQN
jgi:hypothetical protein